MQKTQARILGESNCECKKIKIAEATVALHQLTLI